MSVSTQNRVTTLPRIQALREKHAALSARVEEEQRNLSSPDYYLRHLKKQKLLLKEELAQEEVVGNRRKA